MRLDPTFCVFKAVSVDGPEKRSVGWQAEGLVQLQSKRT